jgi:hypothetical protein
MKRRFLVWLLTALALADLLANRVLGGMFAIGKITPRRRTFMMICYAPFVPLGLAALMFEYAKGRLSEFFQLSAFPVGLFYCICCFQTYCAVRGKWPRWLCGEDDVAFGRKVDEWKELIVKIESAKEDKHRHSPSA